MVNVKASAFWSSWEGSRRGRPRVVSGRGSSVAGFTRDCDAPRAARRCPRPALKSVRRTLFTCPSGPVRAVERAVADGLRHVRRAYLVRAFEVCDGAADLEDSIIGARREPLPRHRLLQESLALLIQPTEASYLTRGHLRVRAAPLAAQTRALSPARREHSPSHRVGGLARGRAALRHLLEAHGRDVHVYV